MYHPPQKNCSTYARQEVKLHLILFYQIMSFSRLISIRKKSAGNAIKNWQMWPEKWKAQAAVSITMKNEPRNTVKIYWLLGGSLNWFINDVTVLRREAVFSKGKIICWKPENAGLDGILLRGLLCNVLTWKSSGLQSGTNDKQELDLELMLLALMSNMYGRVNWEK